MTDKEQKKWHEEKWGTNEEPEETPTERPHCDDDSIMIDGEVVNGCLFIGTNGLTSHKIPYCREFTNNCKDNPNCYFKQLARKAQECEKSKKELKELKRQYKLSCLDCEYKNMKADVNRYRKSLEEIKDYCSSKIKSDFDFIEAYTPILNIINKAKGEK